MNPFQCNMGKSDRILRVVVGLLLIANVFVQHPLGWLGAILVLTGIAGVGPIYHLIGMDTRSTAEMVGFK